jgi:uncharacterized protein YukJ
MAKASLRGGEDLAACSFRALPHSHPAIRWLPVPEAFMPLSTYGILKGTVIGHLRDADDDHYQIQVKAGNTVFRIASNVKSSAPNSPSIVLFQSVTALPDRLIKDLQAIDPGYRKLPSKPDGLAIDYVRSGLVKPKSMKPVPPDAPGADNDLKDLLESAVVKARRRLHATSTSSSYRATVSMTSI